MASDSPDTNASGTRAARSRLKRAAAFCLLALAAAGAAAWFGGIRPGSSKMFRLSGSITASQSAYAKASKPNTVLLIVATNSGGVAVAVQRIINPVFPLHYVMDIDDLVLPGPEWKGPLTVQVFVNMHGRVGISRPGELRGSYRGTAFSGDHNINIVIDEVT